eukprot:CAMPEP_0180199566 /NCGR_PEP_ID=MMETSP0987-20121128/5782_1 /TAXON_ID=697907 /ORGANISM="non described non described, Strain CCMP2293" /LENGTH=49 /DNA_ID= /DNA_START= /DNA_END= /DNA_ORIENTATION=
MAKSNEATATETKSASRKTGGRPAANDMWTKVMPTVLESTSNPTRNAWQ